MCSIIISCSGCFEREKAEKISLEERQVTSNVTIDVQPLRIGVSALISPQGTMIYYEEILDYVSERTGLPVSLVQRDSYLEINELLESRYIDVAFVGPGQYIEGREKFGLELLVAPVVDGEPYYYSYIIVPSNSEVASIAELKGKRFAFTDPLSTTGKYYPTYVLLLMNKTPDTFFSSYVYTHSHEASIEAVARNLVDGASVEGLVWDYLSQTKPETTSKTKIILKSPPYGITPLVVHPEMSLELKEELKTIFLTMHKDPKGEEILDKLDIDMFIQVDDELYDSVFWMRTAVESGNVNRSVAL
ncbi:MAG: phosphate/phosphite/phosphonate ABC transporter substrate-binding protein [Methanosarcinaceae archaeon]|nr:phosphate/phosphite/phosphonate ABC transporter substrate-binding protein [Methanosarcinaceae archaeon]